MGTKAKDFGSSDRVPQAEGSQASGLWGAVRTPREKGKAGFGLPSSSSVRLRMWGRGPRPPHPGWGLPPTRSGSVLLPPGRQTPRCEGCAGVPGGGAALPLGVWLVASPRSALCDGEPGVLWCVDGARLPPGLSLCVRSLGCSRIRSPRRTAVLSAAESLAALFVCLMQL